MSDTTQTPEEWRAVAEFPDYEVSNLGRVRSWKTRYRTPAPRLLTPIVRFVRGKPTGALVGMDGKLRFIHRLVLEAFVGSCPPDLRACHNDGNALNNVPSNLRWDTQYENIQDKRRHGTMHGNVGEDHPFAILTAEDVRCIRAEPRFKGVNLMLAKAFGVSRHTIQSVRSGLKWKSVPQYL